MRIVAARAALVAVVVVDDGLRAGHNAAAAAEESTASATKKSAAMAEQRAERLEGQISRNHSGRGRRRLVQEAREHAARGRRRTLRRSVSGLTALRGKKAAGLGRILWRARPLLQILDLRFGLIQRHLLNQHGLRQNVQRIGLPADCLLDQIVRVAVDMRRRGIADAVREPCDQLLFLFGHFNSLSMVRRAGPTRSAGSI